MVASSIHAFNYVFPSDQINKQIFKAALECISKLKCFEVSKGAKIGNRYNQVPHLTQDGKVTNSQLYTTNESQEVSPFPAGDHKHI